MGFVGYNYSRLVIRSNLNKRYGARIDFIFSVNSKYLYIKYVMNSLNVLKMEYIFSCFKVLPVIVEQFEWMPFVNSKLHISFMRFTFWTLVQLDPATQVK